MKNQLEPIRIDRRKALLGLSTLPLLALSGCAAFDYRESDAPQAMAAVPRLEPPPRLALVLGSGGPRGYAHIGVMRVLEEAGVVPDLVVGSSVGAVLGAFWASGLSAARIDELSLQGGPLTLFDPSPFADRGWVHGQKLQDYVNRGIGQRAMENLPRRLVVVATERETKAARYFMRGNTGVAVRASSAMPGIISPVGIGGVEYEDGDESLPVAVSAARAAGAHFVIAVDVSPGAGATPPDASDALRQRDLRRRARIEPEVAKADFLIHPPVGYWARPARSYFLESRQIGESAARALMPALEQSLSAQGLRS
ncbi:patatin-like phospholipase family protein [Hydrogenophaga sp. PBL-H3]|uniref:patatin-like phospholipase family protein n=1 Tax=Hydrogenophaga sp. PBL-H3 TaxID=434010 RepID=UPI00131F7C27|nr:patatin-like phospholipase family protein [Hydrogenophaga sp. PBL-H3]QHE77447.1 patatin-like phospholipase family protein [Hydrogenophaga sp. PBL-H3]QHE81871.1 patatin-like phospholipase family protein [Hydrogenophaga sp. PBL-H3]